jgi:hypothetical protein
MFCEDFFELGTNRQIHLAKDRARWNGRAVTLRNQAVQGHHLHPAAEKNFRNDAADISRGSSNQNIQERISSTQTRPLPLVGLHTNVRSQFT